MRRVRLRFSLPQHAIHDSSFWQTSSVQITPMCLSFCTKAGCERTNMAEIGNPRVLPCHRAIARTWTGGVLGFRRR